MENKKLSPYADTRSVDLSDDHMVEYWTNELKATKTRLLAAIAEVGDECRAVKKHLKKP